MSSRRAWTRGHQALEEYLRREGALTQTQLAARLGISQPSVNAWVTGDSRPKTDLRLVLEKVIGIPADAWMTTDERKRVERAAEYVPPPPEPSSARPIAKSVAPGPRKSPKQPKRAS